MLQIIPTPSESSVDSETLPASRPWALVTADHLPGKLQVMSMFDAGDHIKVKRPLYTHHGIFGNESRVIDLSGGRNIFDKPKALVQARTLEQFEE